MNCLFAVASASCASRSRCNRNKLVDKTKHRLKWKCFRFHQLNQTLDYKYLVCCCVYNMYPVGAVCPSNWKENTQRRKFEDMFRPYQTIRIRLLYYYIPFNVQLKKKIIFVFIFLFYFRWKRRILRCNNTSNTRKQNTMMK